MKCTRTLWLPAWLGLSIVLTGALLSKAQVAAPTLVTTQEGAMPIILSAPHGGLATVPGVAPRNITGLPGGGSGYVTSRDGNTELLAAAVAKALEAKTGRKPYMVVARFARKYIDANRPPDIAYQDPKAKPVYDVYHDTLDRYCAEVQRKFGRGLLLDLHGQGSAKDTIFRGTQNGKTVELLIQRFGVKSHNGPKSFFGIMSEKGLKGHPLDGGEEQAGYTGGHIVKTYGSHQGHGIDAIQLEFGGNFRARDRIDDTAAKLAEVIIEYSRLYLPDRPRGAVMP